MAKKTTKKAAAPKAKDKVRVCMVGAGGMANGVHYPTLAGAPDVEIVGVCDLDAGRVASTIERHRIPGDVGYVADTLFDYQKMIEKLQPDAVYAIGQPEIHFHIWMWCLEQGLPLYIEKPMGLNIHQARMLEYAAREAGVITQVSHQRRTSPLLVKMHTECLKRGPITHSVCEFFKCEQHPLLGAMDHMMGDCTHAVDTVRWMNGGEVVGIDSVCRCVGTPDINWIGATLHFDNGSIGYVVNSWCSGRRVFRVQMHAPGIYVDAEVEGKAYLYADGDYEGVMYDTREMAGCGENRVYGGFVAKNREFIDSVKTGVDVTSSPFRDCVKTMEVCEAILAQSTLETV